MRELPKGRWREEEEEAEEAGKEGDGIEKGPRSRRGARGGAKRQRAGDAQSCRAHASGLDTPCAGLAGEEPRFWPQHWTKDKKHTAGYKVLVQDMPSSMRIGQIRRWIFERQCPEPIDVNNGIGLSPRGRLQVCLTFATPEQAHSAKTLLHNRDLEKGAHPTQTKWWKSRA